MFIFLLVRYTCLRQLKGPPTVKYGITSYWLCHFPAPTQPGINTPHNPSTDILHSPAYEDGTDSEFRNVDNENSDAGELLKKEQITFRTRRKLKNKKDHLHYKFSCTFTPLLHFSTTNVIIPCCIDICASSYTKSHNGSDSWPCTVESLTRLATFE